MGAAEKLIGVGLTAVLVVGVVDAAAGHDDSSKSTPQPVDMRTEPTQPSSTASSSSEPTPVPTKSAGRKHHRDGDATSSATPTGVPTGSAPSGSTAPASPASSSKPSAPSGILGTFSYATTGGEGTSIPGTQRDFPKTTKITNKLKSCGVASTWKPIPEHVQTQVLCPADDGIKVSSYETTISFYGVSSGETFTCSGPSYVYRDGVAAGDTWRFKCKSPDATAVQKSTAIGFETIDVGGTAVRTLHVHVDTTLHGDSSGTSNEDYWIGIKKPVLVKETGKVTATQRNVHYTSSYSLALKSLSPKT